jgi:hypothetical protein
MPSSAALRPQQSLYGQTDRGVTPIVIARSDSDAAIPSQNL